MWVPPAHAAGLHISGPESPKGSTFTLRYIYNIQTIAQIIIFVSDNCQMSAVIAMTLFLHDLIPHVDSYASKPVHIFRILTG